MPARPRNTTAITPTSCFPNCSTRTRRSEGFPPLKGGKGDSKHKPISNNDHFFLAARAHYINGVGYYENDSAVQACTEYLKALEINEKRFEEKELVGERARFMALTYTHLKGLFSDQYLHEQAIYFGKAATDYYEKYNAMPWHKAWMLNTIGSHYEMMDALDSAELYYQKAVSFLDDTTLLIYRDVSTHLAYLSYKKDKDVRGSVNHLHKLLLDAESEKEYLARCLIIGGVYYHEKQFDSAYVYFNKVFHHSQSIGARKQAAEWLIDICETVGRDSETFEYATFLVPFANQNENQSHLKSQLTKMFHDYERERLEIVHRKQLRKLGKHGGAALLALSAIALVFIAFHFINKKRHRYLKSQNEEKEKQFESIRYEYEIQQKALLGKLKQRNEELQELKGQMKQRGKSNVHEPQAATFAEEPVCQLIMERVNKGQFKSQMDCRVYKDFALSKAQLSALREAADRHFNRFTYRLSKDFPELTKTDLDYAGPHRCRHRRPDAEGLQHRQRAQQQVEKGFWQRKPDFSHFAGLCKRLFKQLIVKTLLKNPNKSEQFFS